MGRYPFKLVTFDVNGTLLKPKGAIGQTYAQFARRRGLSVDPQILDGGFRVAYKSMSRNHPNFGQAGLQWKCWWQAVVRETFKSAIGLADEKKLSQIDVVTDDLIKHFSTGESWEIENGALEVLERLKNNSVGLGVVSNTDPRLHGILDDLRMAKYFVFVLTSYEAKVAKPDVQIFLHARDAYSRISGTGPECESILHVGNSYDLDYLGAKRAGWQGILVNCKDPVTDPGCLSFGNLKDLDDHFVKLGCD
ncbi:unnamed protein product [Nesidiocoris tenuis]|uniref:Haloacid dehalogenase-like hydrolase domain-containing protein 3 n=1 Tax=Nesidiocoris tenuis TaxID=355587 RepID=A0A6H5HEU2_9HEMI|nr:unnamed protein product [Nesidiocoris tenuis]